jgi:hypothetical protein
MSHDRSARPDEYPGTPLWVKLFALGAVVVIVAIVLVLVVGTAMGVHAPGGPGHVLTSPAHSR